MKTRELSGSHRGAGCGLSPSGGHASRPGISRAPRCRFVAAGPGHGWALSPGASGTPGLVRPPHAWRPPSSQAALVTAELHPRRPPGLCGCPGGPVAPQCSEALGSVLQGPQQSSREGRRPGKRGHQPRGQRPALGEPLTMRRLLNCGQGAAPGGPCPRAKPRPAEPISARGRSHGATALPRPGTHVDPRPCTDTASLPLPWCPGPQPLRY